MGRRFALALSLLGCSALSLSAAAQERIVSIGPATTELILALGGEQSLIATDISSTEPKNLPRVGYHRALAAEGDVLARKVLRGMIKELSTSELIKKTNASPNELAAARRRVQRRLNDAKAESKTMH